MKNFATFLALLLSSSSFSQDEVIIIDRSKSDTYKSKSRKEVRLNENTQVVKFAPLNLLAGEVLFGYERQHGVKGSLDFELGPTLSKIGFGINSHWIDASTPSEQDLSGIGIVSGVSYRYYPLDETEALNRFYVAPQFRFKAMNHKVQDVNGFVSGVQRGTQMNSNFYFNFGYQSWLSSTFAMDFYMGFGIGMRTERDYNLVAEFQDTDWVYDWEETNYSGAVYVFQMGLKVGIGSK